MTSKWAEDMSEKEVKIKFKGEEISLTIRPLTWSKKNQILSKCFTFTKTGNSFDLDAYNKECLAFMIAKAPWGATDKTFLTSIGPELGSALQELVPTVGMVESEDDVDFFGQESDKS